MKTLALVSDVSKTLVKESTVVVTLVLLSEITPVVKHVSQLHINR